AWSACPPFAPSPSPPRKFSPGSCRGTTHVSFLWSCSAWVAWPRSANRLQGFHQVLVCSTQMTTTKTETVSRSEELFARAIELMPGGVNSPVRAFRGVGGTPIFIKKASGATITDVDGRTYIDYVGSWGPMILGHADEEIVSALQEVVAGGTSFGAPNELEVTLAEEVIDAVPSIEMVRMVNS